MLIDCTQLKEIIIVPTLSALGLNSPSAVNLLLGTAAQESHLGRYLRQLHGSALGLYQIEPRTFESVWSRRIETSYAMKARLRLMLGYEGKPDVIRLASDLMLSTAICRLYYATFEEPLPDENDVQALAEYWKKYWNTSLGKGRPEQFVENYHRYVV